MSNVVVTFSGEAAKLHATMDRMFKQQQKIIDAYNKGSDASKKANQTALKEMETKKKLAEAERRNNKEKERARQLVQQILTPQEKFNRKMKELNDLRAKGRVFAQEHARLEAKYTQELKEEEAALEAATSAGKRKTAAEKTAKDVQERLKTSTQRYREEVKKLVQAKREGAISADQLRQRHQQLRAEMNTKVDSRQGVVGAVVKLSAGYLTASTAIQKVMQGHQDLVDVQRESRDLALEIAKAQEAALKNFAGLSAMQQKEFAGDAKRIAATAGVPNIPEVTRALSETQSTVADKELATSIVQTVARVTRNNPEALAGISVGTGVVSSALGLKTPEEVEQAAGLLLGITSQSNVVTQPKLARAAGPVIRSAIGKLDADAPLALRAEQARGAGAGFAAFTKAAADPTGESSTTAFITAQQEMYKLFQSLPGEIKEREARLQELAGIEKTSTAESVATRKAEVALRKREEILSELKKDKGATKLEIDEAQVNVDSAKETLAQKRLAEGLTPEQVKEKALLRQEIVELKRGVTANPRTFQEQVAFFQANPALANRVAEGKLMAAGVGERRFQDAMKQLLTPGSQTANEFAKAMGVIQFSPDEFNKQLQGQRATKELRMGDMAANFETARQLALLSGDKGEIAEISDFVTESMKLANAGRDPVAGSLGVVQRSLAGFRISRARTTNEALRIGAGILRNQMEGGIAGITPPRPGTAQPPLPADAFNALATALVELTDEMRKREAEMNNAAENLNEAAANLNAPGAGAQAQAGLAGAGAL